MAHFIGYTKEKITLPIKPIFTEIKGWVLLDNGYFVYWFWYIKEDGPQGISKIPKLFGRNKIAIVIIILLKTFIPQKPCGGYSVMLDNLFIFIKILVYLSAKASGLMKLQELIPVFIKILLTLRNLTQTTLFRGVQGI